MQSYKDFIGFDITEQSVVGVRSIFDAVQGGQRSAVPPFAFLRIQVGTITSKAVSPKGIKANYDLWQTWVVDRQSVRTHPRSTSAVPCAPRRGGSAAPTWTQLRAMAAMRSVYSSSPQQLH